MDSDFWTSRLAAAKRQLNQQQQNQHHFDGGSHMDDDYEMVEDELGVGGGEIGCPYCYQDLDIISLPTHLQHQHSSDSTPTVCPICSIKVPRDMLSHITLQHAHLFKLHRRRRLRRLGIPNTQPLSLFGRDLREAHLQLLLGGVGLRSNNVPPTSIATDPFLSSLVFNFPGSDVHEISKSLSSTIHDTTQKNSSSTSCWKPSLYSSLSSEERKRRIKQATGRADFVQDLLFCSVLGD